MPNNSLANELKRAGVDFADYRELARPVQDGGGAARWPLIAATDQVLVAQRWKRESLQAKPGSVTPLPTARASAPTSSAEWFLSEAAPPPPPAARPRAI